jgi:hypothetical protein
VLIDRAFIPIAMVSMALANRSTKAVRVPVAQLHREPPDASVLREHLHHGWLAKIPSVTRQHRKEHLFFFAEVEAGIMSPELEKIPGGLREFDLFSDRGFLEPSRVDEPLMMVVREAHKVGMALHTFSLVPFVLAYLVLRRHQRQ